MKKSKNKKEPRTGVNSNIVNQLNNVKPKKKSRNNNRKYKYKNKSNYFKATPITNLSRPLVPFSKRSNNSKKITDFILNPYKMGLNNEFYSIYPTELKVVKMSLYSRAAVIMQADEYLTWFPYGVGSKTVIDQYSNIDIDGSGHHINHFSNTFHTNVNKEVLALPTKTIDFKCRYRVIGCSLKITNLTSITNKNGCVFITKGVNENNASPVYYYSAQQPYVYKILNATFTNAINELLNANQQNAPIKNNINSTQTAYLNEINNKQGNIIFTGDSEYLQTTYYASSSNGVAYISGNNKPNNSVYYNMHFANDSPQTYLFEQWQIIEANPSGESIIGGLARDSLKGCSNRIQNLINKVNPIRVVESA
jgi:hypothetical protein